MKSRTVKQIIEYYNELISTENTVLNLTKDDMLEVTQYNFRKLLINTKSTFITDLFFKLLVENKYTFYITKSGVHITINE